ncbi:uncharacterized protein K452DRAFT_280214 [Aplosporella prunicola CBS 121167]|uniref:DUF7580 domain-containing protein n=1 Tax=Aplosporella prunicola CBS 121167 TaxID=1176127 RepID=A0A6A6AZ56_9PEZI|nr:uncharacterized protein K452DRAFT_280214 [Aplosporella prunicola CBS 121167]KAF2136284.1 hypothetical protein K452DRAFT_280214 [Aplosporella prunicola CBS 121167]
MSGIEVAGLVFGLVPIICQILESYRQVNERITTFRRYHKAAADITLDFQLEERAFRSECKHVLSAIGLDQQELADMLQHIGANQWQDRDIEHRLNDLLGAETTVYEELVLKIREQLREITRDLAALSSIATPGSSEGSFRQLCHAFNVSAKENRYRRAIKSLQILNAKFRRLRKQICSHEDRSPFFSYTNILKSVPQNYYTIRQASKMLHLSMGDAWSCLNSSHDAHLAKLCLNSTVDHNQVRLDMAISCRKIAEPQLKYVTRSVPGPPIWVYVQSVAGNISIPRSSSPHTPLVTTLISSVQIGSTEQPPPSPQRQPVGSAFSGGIKRCKKRVRFDSKAFNDNENFTPEPKEKKLTTPKPGSTEQCYAMLNLRNTKSFCCHLNQSCASPGGCKLTCLGFLESGNACKFVFYDSGKGVTAGKSQHKEMLPLNTTLSALSPLQRLTLAHKLASTVLQYHSTPWLSDHWKLQDLTFFGDKTGHTPESLAEDLQTLHLTSQFSTKSDTAIGNRIEEPGSVDSAETTRNIAIEKTYRYTYNIKNMTLAKLGLALLEIGHKKDIEKFDLGQQQHDVISARILADSPHTDFGPRYQRIVRKCLDCNFATGDDLADKSLRDAVYSHVVCELEEMIEAHKNWQKATQ